MTAAEEAAWREDGCPGGGYLRGRGWGWQGNAAEESDDALDAPTLPPREEEQLAAIKEEPSSSDEAEAARPTAAKAAETGEPEILDDAETQAAVEQAIEEADPWADLSLQLLCHTIRAGSFDHVLQSLSPSFDLWLQA